MIKTFFSISLVFCFFSISNTAFANAKSRQELQADLNASNAALTSLESEKVKATARIKAHLPFTKAGMILLEKYSKLLKVRYVDEDGEYQPGSELGAKDRDNINKLLGTYLKSMPFKTPGKTSVAQAIREIQSSIERLQTLASAEESPSDDKCPELEILAKKIQDAKEKSQQLKQKLEQGK